MSGREDRDPPDGGDDGRGGGENGLAVAEIHPGKGRRAVRNVIREEVYLLDDVATATGRGMISIHSRAFGGELS